MLEARALDVVLARALTNEGVIENMKAVTEKDIQKLCVHCPEGPNPKKPLIARAFYISLFSLGGGLNMRRIQGGA